MKLISLDKILYRYNKPIEYDGIKFLPDKVQKKARKLKEKLEEITFDLTPYNLGYLKFTELFELTCLNKACDVVVKQEDPMTFCYAQTKLKPNADSSHPLVEMCRRMLSSGSKIIKSQAGWFPSYQMACIDIYESMVDSINRYLKHIIALYHIRFEIDGIPKDIGVFDRFCKATNRYEFSFEIAPKHVKKLIDAYRADGWETKGCDEYREYLIEELAKASVAAKNDKVTPSEPLAYVFPITVYVAIVQKQKEDIKLHEDCKETIEQIHSKVDDIRVSRMETTNV